MSYVVRPINSGDVIFFRNWGGHVPDGINSRRGCPRYPGPPLRLSSPSRPFQQLSEEQSHGPLAAPPRPRPRALTPKPPPPAAAPRPAVPTRLIVYAAG